MKILKLIDLEKEVENSAELIEIIWKINEITDWINDFEDRATEIFKELDKLEKDKKEK